MSWLAKLLQRRTDAGTVRNDGLALAMDWGESWLSPIQGRLRQQYGYLGPAELDEINSDCQGAMRLAHETVYGWVRDGANNMAAEGLEAVLRAKYPWISPANIHRLFNQSLYYATKAGGPARSA